MAFPAAPGWNNLPNGLFSPVIYSKKAQMAFRKTSVVADITNSDYFGEIKDFGDSVRILKEPEITVAPYRRGTQIQAQDLLDEDFTLIIDQANYYAFKIDDIEDMQSHVDFAAMAADRAGYRMKDNYDQEILAYMSGYKQSALHLNGDTARTSADVPGTPALTSASTSTELLSVNVLKKGDFSNITTSMAGDHSIPIAARFPGVAGPSTSTVTPVALFNRAGRLLDQQNVPTDGRWAIVDPIFAEVMRTEDSPLVNLDWGRTDGIRNGKLGTSPLYGFRLYVSQNLPKIGTGPGTSGSANQNSNFGVVIFGVDSAVATAEQISKTEKYRDPDSFADIVRGMHLYGRKQLAIAA